MGTEDVKTDEIKLQTSNRKLQKICPSEWLQQPGRKAGFTSFVFFSVHFHT